MPEALRFKSGRLQDLSEPFGVRRLSVVDRLPLGRGTLGRGSQILRIHAARGQHLDGHAFAFFQQSEQQVLGVDLRLLQASGFPRGQGHRRSSPLREVLVHSFTSIPHQECT